MSYKMLFRPMDQNKALALTAELIMKGDDRISVFKDIYSMVNKTTIQRLTGIRYNRIRESEVDPGKLKMDEIILIAHALKVPPEKITGLILAQLAPPKKQKPA